MHEQQILHIELGVSGEENDLKTGSQLPMRFARKGAVVTKVFTASSQVQVHRNIGSEQRKTFPER